MKRRSACLASADMQGKYRHTSSCLCMKQGTFFQRKNHHQCTHQMLTELGAGGPESTSSLASSASLAATRSWTALCRSSAIRSVDLSCCSWSLHTTYARNHRCHQFWAGDQDKVIHSLPSN